MPFYDMFCTACQKEFNVMATMAEKAERRIACPECSSTKMETIYKSAPAYIKGTGDKMPDCPNKNSCAMGCRHQ